MSNFTNIKELISALHKEQKLLTEMFKRRRNAAYKYEYALELTDNNENRIQYLIDRSVLHQNGDNLAIDDQFLQFFEQVLEINEEINASYINENIEKVKQNINYYLNENNEQRKFNYLKVIKNTLRKLGNITLRNVIDLKRNTDNTFKNEPNYKIKKTKLENLDMKRVDISGLIDQTEKLITEEELTFFTTATDEELNRIIIQLRMELGKSTHNLIEIEKQIIDFLNQIKYQGNVIEKLRQVKYLKDQFILETATDFKQVVAAGNPVVFESRPVYPLKLSVPFLQTDEEAFQSIIKTARRVNSGVKFKRPVADRISDEYLETQTEEELLINLEEVKNGFVASSHNLFDFIMNYDFFKEVSIDDRITIFCQLISQYDELFEFTGQYNTSADIEYAMVYPK